MRWKNIKSGVYSIWVWESECLWVWEFGSLIVGQFGPLPYVLTILCLDHFTFWPFYILAILHLDHFMFWPFDVLTIWRFYILGGCSWASWSSWCWSWWLESTPSYWDTPTNNFWCLNQVFSSSGCRDIAISSTWRMFLSFLIILMLIMMIGVDSII